MGNQLAFSYTIVAPPHASVSLVHGVAQRRLPGPDLKGLEKSFQPFLSRSWLADLPADVRGAILNLGRASPSDDLPGGPLLQAVLDLANRCRVERGTADVLVQDEQTQMSGQLCGGPITVAGRFGKATVPLDEVALLAGGADVDRTNRVYLRNGEILSGDVQAGDLVLKTSKKLELKLLLAQVHFLFLHAEKTDGAPPPQAVALVQTHAGERLAVRGGPAARFRAATPWGPLEFALDEVQGLCLRRDPQPVYRLCLKDGSRLPIMLQGDEAALDSTRFGPIKLPPAAIAQIRGLGNMPPRGGTVADGSEDGDESESLTLPACTLLGENVLVGALADAKLTVRAASGMATIDAAQVRKIQRRDDSPPTFALDMGEETPLVGALVEPVLAIRRGTQVWRLPLQHVVTWRLPSAEPAAAKVLSPPHDAPFSSAAPRVTPAMPRSTPPAAIYPDDDPFAQ